MIKLSGDRSPFLPLFVFGQFRTEFSHFISIRIIILHNPFERTRDSIFLSPGTDGGRGGIRTPGTVSGSAVFKTAALDHSATLPEDGATCRTRTDDLRFTKPLLYQLS